MKRKRIYGFRRTSLQRSPMKHLAEDGTLLKADGGVEDSEMSNADNSKREARKKVMRSMKGIGGFLNRMF